MSGRKHTPRDPRTPGLRARTAPPPDFRRCRTTRRRSPRRGGLDASSSRRVAHRCGLFQLAPRRHAAASSRAKTRGARAVARRASARRRRPREPKPASRPSTSSRLRVRRCRPCEPNTFGNAKEASLSSDESPGPSPLRVVRARQLRCGSHVRHSASFGYFTK